MKSVAKEYTSMKCKEKEDLIEIRVSVKFFFFKTFLFLSDLFFLNRTSKHCQFEQNDNDNVRLNNQDFKIISQDKQ